MSRYSLVAGLTILFFTACPALAHGFKTPEEAVNSYIKAVKTGSGKHVEMAFSETASIQYYNDKGVYQSYTRDAFAALVNTGNQWDANIHITDLKTTGYAANATVAFSWGEEQKKGYIDYLNLIYDGKSWHITDKVAQYIDRN
ncbi:nuclear transport factor 2 family protein [Planctobacterium marinum]|uniref:nuclear transport factor 2 family protein n=1 Tax=Planctobacterium marinum TaxID=1631968 RepID=UPI001E39BE4A|nr:nuclear transport factor 2 family protein [Planctobacterium marinum]MCC2606733.1 nuclear transport factor 2 family protein [Planctobacterium marinum]